MEDLLLQVERPGRYIGAEFNSNLEEKRDAHLKFAICFPNLYEIGMSNLGLRIIYGLLNSGSDCLCERFFLPAPDMLDLINCGKAKFRSLESDKDLSDFDIVGFSLAHELDYTNVLHILNISHIPYNWRERNETYPLIIAGGSALSNPEPVAEFFDIILIGEAEEVILELIAEFKKWRNKLNRAQILKRLAKIEGIYIPALFEPALDIAHFSIKRQFIKDLNSSFYPLDWIVPYISIIHDKILLELMRGCPHSCRFCQARMFYSPLRIKKRERVIQSALTAQERSGYEEISLLGLSSSDHPQIKDILNCLIESLRSQCIGISLGSLRPTAIVSDLLETVAKVKKIGLTLAIESGSSELRALLNKQIDVEAVKKAIMTSYAQGQRRVKLYFMFGLPFETEADLEATARMIYELAHIRGKFRKNLLLTVSINPFIPKPHTVFQWHPMNDLETLERKKKFLKRAIYRYLRNIKIDFQTLEMSFVEALLSRGDRKVSRVIIEAFKTGAIMDGFSDYFNFSIWRKALDATKLDVSHYIYRQIPTDERLAWDHIDMGYEKADLKSEYQKVIEEGRNRKAIDI